MSQSASFYVAMYDDKLVAFLAIMQFPGINGAKRVHRMVVLPEYQGLGIAYHFGDYIAKRYVDKNWNMFYITSNRGLVRSLNRNKHWEKVSQKLNAPFFNSNFASKKLVENERKKAFKRFIYSFKTNKEIWYRR